MTMIRDETKFISLSDFKMRVRIVGPSEGASNKEPLLLVMGYRGHLGWWPEEFVQHYAKSQKVILFDNRGAGQSSRGKKKYSIQTLAHDIKELIEHLGLLKVSLLGVSMGGMIAMECAIEFPDLIQNLIIANSMRKLKIEKPWRQNFLKLVTIYSKNHRVRKAPLFLSLIFTPKFLEDADDREWEKILTAFNTDVIKRPYAVLQLKSILAWKRSAEDFRQISCPTLVLCADQDLLCPPQNSLEIVKDLWDVHYIRIKELGHAMLYEGLSQILPSIDQFLAQTMTSTFDRRVSWAKAANAH